MRPLSFAERQREKTTVSVKRMLDGGAEINGSSAIERDFPERGQQIRKPEILRSWMSAYAAATAPTMSYEKILDLATPGLANRPAKETALAYRNVLSQLWLLDPALSARLLGLDEERLLSARGRRIGFEVKLDRTVDDRDVKHLLWLKDLLGEDLTDAAVIYTGESACRRRGGIAVVPLALLGA